MQARPSRAAASAAAAAVRPPTGRQEVPVTFKFMTVAGAARRRRRSLVVTVTFNNLPLGSEVTVTVHHGDSRDSASATVIVRFAAVHTSRMATKHPSG